MQHVIEPEFVSLVGIGERVLTGPQSFGRIVTLPDSETAMIQLEHLLASTGAMISHGLPSDLTQNVHMSQFEWDVAHDYWKPKAATGDRLNEKYRVAYRHDTCLLIVSGLPCK